MKNKIVPFVILSAFLGMILFLNWSYVFISDDCFYGSICVDGHWQHLETIATAFSETLKDLHRPVVHFIVRVFTGCFDKWIFNLANTAMMGVLLLLVNRVAYRSWRIDARSLALSIFLVFFTLCKGESLVWCAGSVNYLWVAVWTLAFCLVRERLESTEGGLSPWMIMLFALAAVLCGGSNETFTPPMCFAIGVCALIDWRRLTISKIVVYGTYFIPVLLMAVYEKTHRVGAMMPPFSASSLVLTAIKTAVTVKCVWVLAICFAFCRDKKAFARRNLFELLVVFASIGMVLAVGFHGERTLYCANLFALVVILREWHPGRIFCIAALAAVTLTFAGLVPCALRIRQNTLSFLQQYLAASDNVGCHEFVSCGPLGWYFYQEIYNWQTGGAHPFYVGAYYGGGRYPTGLSRELYDHVYLRDDFCRRENALRLASGLKAYTKPEMNTIVIPLAHNRGLAAGCQHVTVSYDVQTGLLSALKRDFAKFGHPVIPEPSRPVLLKTPHGSYYLVAKEPFSDSFIKDVTLIMAH